MGKRTKSCKMFPSLKSTVILFCIFILVQIRGRSFVSGESVYVPNMPINPDVLHFLHMRQGQANHLNTPKDNSSPEGENHDATILEGVDSYRKIYSQGVNPEVSEMDGGYGEAQQRQQLAPGGFLFSKQFSQSSNPKIFNQPNGLLMDKEVSMDETTGRLGLLTGFNEFNLPSKHVVIRSRPPRFQVVGPPSTAKRTVGRDGYMCHFKLCQLGASGKRRWSPLFEND